MELYNTHNSWYKGNLHTHTTLSDGAVAPNESIKRYKNAGYDFLAITDHRKFYPGRLEKNGDKDFLLLSGIEFDLNDLNLRKAWHIVGIDMDNSAFIDGILAADEEKLTPQDVINSIAENKGVAILAHPFWSLLTHEDVIKLGGYIGIEVWNEMAGFLTNRADSTDYIDICASKGKFTYIFAVDDTHAYSRDLFGGYIMVNSEGLNKTDIMNNIKKGNFYCSQGPQIKQIHVLKNEMHVKTSPVEFISFMSDTFYCGDRIARHGSGLIEEASYTIKDTDRVVRIECKDVYGKRAWSQLIKVNE